MKKKLVGLFIMIDALGHRFLRDNEFLPQLEYRTGLRTVLGFSCACQPTLLTGKMPHDHGHGAMYMRRDGPSPLDAAKPFAWMPGWIADNHRVRAHIQGRVAKKVRGYFSLYHCPTRLLPRFDLVEHESIFAPKGIRAAKSIFDTLEEYGIAWRCHYYDRPESECFELADADLASGEVDFIFLYLTVLDGLLHASGNGGTKVLDHLRWYDESITSLLNRAHDTADTVEAYVFGDHGMSDVHGSLDLLSEIERRFGPNGGRYLAFYDSTMARFWSEDQSVNRALVACLNQRSDGRVIFDEELAELGVGFRDRSQGDVIFVVNEGLLLVPSYMGDRVIAGMHGYHPNAEFADAGLLGLHAPDKDTRHLRDLYTLMEDVALRLREDGH